MEKNIYIYLKATSRENCVRKELTLEFLRFSYRTIVFYEFKREIKINNGKDLFSKIRRSNRIKAKAWKACTEITIDNLFSKRRSTRLYVSYSEISGFLNSPSCEGSRDDLIVSESLK